MWVVLIVKRNIIKEIKYNERKNRDYNCEIFDE